MSLRPLLGLAQALVALLLLASAPVAAAPHARAVEAGPFHHRPAQALVPYARELPGWFADMAASADVDDDPESLALGPVRATVAPTSSARLIGFAYAHPPLPSHWPCASLSTGPPALE
jgi:hypothetical protein